VTGACAVTSLPRPRALLFDWDNTLVDSWPVIHEALNATLEAMGHDRWSLETTKERVRFSLRDSFPKLFGESWTEARQLYLDAFRAIHLDRLRPLPGRTELIEDLAAEGFCLAVVSNKTGPLLRLEAAALGWDRYFARLVGAMDAAADKPQRAPVDMALAGTGIAAGAEVWLIGDTAVDIECALNAGCIPVLLGADDAATPEFRDFKPLLSFNECSNLFLHLRTL
jgi:phosphoglycolate phosphatase